MPAPAAGIMSQHLCAANDVVQIGSVLAHFEEADGLLASTSTSNPKVLNKSSDKDQQIAHQSQNNNVSSSQSRERLPKKNAVSSSISNTYVNQDLL